MQFTLQPGANTISLSINIDFIHRATKQMWQFCSLLLVSLLISESVAAEEIIGRVVGVTDGDTHEKNHA